MAYRSPPKQPPVEPWPLWWWRDPHRIIPNRLLLWHLALTVATPLVCGVLGGTNPLLQGLVVVIGDMHLTKLVELRGPRSTPGVVLTFRKLFYASMICACLLCEGVRMIYDEQP